MLCALSQFLDRNAHVADQPSSPPLPDSGSVRPTSPSPDRVKFSNFVPICGAGFNGKNGKANNSDSANNRSRSKSKILDLSYIRTHMIRSKSFPTNKQNVNETNNESNAVPSPAATPADTDSSKTNTLEDPHPRIPSSWSSENVAGEASGAGGKTRDFTSSGEQTSSSQQTSPNNGSFRRHNRRHLPVPTGPHTVGCVDLMCDLADQGTFFRLYYPTNPTDIHRAYKQWPLWLPRKQYAHGYVYFLKKNRTIFGRLANWLGGDVYAPVLWQAPLLKSEDKFPVIIVSHGIGGNRTTLSAYSYELASRGFVVAALEHRDGSASMTLCLTEQLGSSIVESDEVTDTNNKNNDNKRQHQQRHKRHHSTGAILQQNNNSKDKHQQHGEKHSPNETTQAVSGDTQSTLTSDNRDGSDSGVRFDLGAASDDNSTTSASAKEDDNISSNSCSSSSDVYPDYPNNVTLRREEDAQERRAEESTQTTAQFESCESSTEDKDVYNEGDVNDQLRADSCRRMRPPHTAGTSRERHSMPEGDGSHGAWVRQRKENRRRSLRHNHSCTEEWRPFQHVEVWDDFNYRNNQMYQRADEISDLLDELISMNEGSHINNALGLAFTTNQFKNRLDFSRVAVIGHSFGGATTLATLVTDERFKVGLCLDSWMHPVDSHVYNNTKQPALFLNMDNFQWEKNVKRMIRFQEANPGSDRPMMTLMGGCHQSMTDFQFLVPQVVGRLMDVCYTLSPTQCMATVMSVTMAYLRKHLDMPPEAGDEKILSCQHPHLMQGTNVDLTIPDDGPTPPGYDTVSPSPDD